MATLRSFRRFLISEDSPMVGVDKNGQNGNLVFRTDLTTLMTMQSSNLFDYAKAITFGFNFGRINFGVGNGNKILNLGA